VWYVVKIKLRDLMKFRIKLHDLMKFRIKLRDLMKFRIKLHDLMMFRIERHKIYKTPLHAVIERRCENVSLMRFIFVPNILFFRDTITVLRSTGPESSKKEQNNYCFR